MEEYELVFILAPNLKEKEQKEQQAKVEKLISGLKGKIIKKDVWGKKKLAYPIKKFEEGTYIKFDFELPKEKISSWDKLMRREENIIRYLLVRVEEPTKRGG